MSYEVQLDPANQACPFQPGQRLGNFVVTQVDICMSRGMRPEVTLKLLQSDMPERTFFMHEATGQFKSVNLPENFLPPITPIMNDPMSIDLSEVEDYDGGE